MAGNFSELLSAFAGLLALFFVSADPAEALSARKLGLFDSPADIASTPDAPGQLFIVEQPGTIRVLVADKIPGSLFLDIKKLVMNEGERGLLSMTFSPTYKTDGLFYVFFVNKDGDIEVDEFKRSNSDPLKAVASSRRKLITVNHRKAGNHNGGQVKFGPDGFLYISIGDGGNPGDGTDGRPASLLTSNLGKVLRINVKPSGKKPYSIPSDNPYVGKAGNDEIYAYGLRNPWRFAFSGNDIIIADVGQGSWEEVNFRPVAKTKGINFGWPAVEGMGHPYFTQFPGPDKPTNPVFEYSHNDGGCAITGGFVVANAKLPTLNGRYIYADYCTGEIRSLLLDHDSKTGLDDKTSGLSYPYLTTFGVGTSGQIYFAASGNIYRVRP